MSNYGSKKHSSKNMDLLYLLLPIIGAFLLLFLVCCFGKKVKEMLHIPKELVLGRNFPGLASSTSSSTSSSRSSLSGNDADDSDDDVGEPALVINMNMERQRVLAQHRRRYYAQVPSDEMVFSLQNEEVECPAEHQQRRLSKQHHLAPNMLAGSLTSKCRLPLWNKYQGIHRKTKNRQRRADSCPLLTESPSRHDELLTKTPVTSYLNVIYAPYNSRQHPGYRVRYNAGADVISVDLDSDSSDIPTNTSPTLVLEKPDRRRHRSNSESDLTPKRCAEFRETDPYLPLVIDSRLSKFSHRLSSTEFQLHHAPQDCITISVPTSDCDQRSDLSQAEVG